MKNMGATSTESAHRSGFKVFVILLMALCLPGFWFSFSLAQEPPITSSGLNTQISGPTTLPSGQINHNITGGTRTGGGTNLFHSFGNFDIPTNNIANFFNDSGVATSNILCRVTGGDISNIFGTIQTTNFGNANLFLMNPVGFLFGPNATLNVSGLVAFTSADYLRLADGALFNAIPNATADALLSAAPVVAFGFLGSNPGAITVQGSQFSVADGTGISLIGGNIAIQNGTLENGSVQPARLSAPNGQVNLATAKSPGEFLQDLKTAPNVNGASFMSYGSVHFAPGSTVDVSQTGNGKVSIRGGQLVLEIQNAFLSTADSAALTVITPGQDTIILSGGSSIASVTTSADPGPNVQIVADDLQFLGTPPAFFPLETPPNPVNILTTTLGNGDAGNITVTANQDLDLSTVTLQSQSQSASATGNAGNINLTSTNGNISMTNGVFVTSQATGAAGKAGTITVSAPNGDIFEQLSVILNVIGLSGSGGGGIRVTANNLTMGSFSGIQIDNFNLPVPGAITVHLSGDLSLDGNATIQTVARGPALAAADLNITAHDVHISEGSSLNTETQSSGPGGQLNIFANNLQITTGGRILSGSTLGADPLTGNLVSPSGPGGIITIQGLSGPVDSVLIDGPGSGILTDTVGTGAGGNTSVIARTLTIQNGGTISATTKGLAPIATGGSITVTTTDHVTMTNGASITASSEGPADAGKIFIDAGQQFEMRDSSITTTATQASGGNIDIQAVDRVLLVNSPISTTVRSGAGSGGNITIDPNVVVLLNSPITARADQGAGGNITITTPLFLRDSSSPVSASSERGVNGTVTIQSPNAPASGHIQPLDKSPLQATSLLNQRCASLAGGEFSSFTVAGRDSLPTEPDSWLASPLATLNAGMGLGAKTEGGRAEGMTLESSSTGETPLLSLRQIAPAGFLTQAFAVDSSASCQS